MERSDNNSNTAIFYFYVRSSKQFYYIKTTKKSISYSQARKIAEKLLKTRDNNVRNDSFITYRAKTKSNQTTPSKRKKLKSSGKSQLGSPLLNLIKNNSHNTLTRRKARLLDSYVVHCLFHENLKTQGILAASSNLYTFTQGEELEDGDIIIIKEKPLTLKDWCKKQLAYWTSLFKVWPVTTSFFYCQ